MNTKSVFWIAAIAGYIPPLGVVSEFGRMSWPRTESRRRRALQAVANSLCTVLTEDRRYPNEVRLNLPEGGRLSLDLLTRRCTLNDIDIGTIGIVDRLSLWLHRQLGSAQIPEERIHAARIDVDYTAADRTYLARGRVWEMRFSLRSELAAGDKCYVGTAAPCTAAVPYGVGAIIAW